IAEAGPRQPRLPAHPRRRRPSGHHRPRDRLGARARPLQRAARRRPRPDRARRRPGRTGNNPVMRTRATIAVAAVALVVAPAVAHGGAANGGLPNAPSNPIAGMSWGAYKIPSTDPGIDPPSAYFNTAHNDADRAEFAKLLAQPRFRW